MPGHPLRAAARRHASASNRPIIRVFRRLVLAPLSSPPVSFYVAGCDASTRATLHAPVSGLEILPGEREREKLNYEKTLRTFGRQPWRFSRHKNYCITEHDPLEATVVIDGIFMNVRYIFKKVMSDFMKLFFCLTHFLN